MDRRNKENSHEFIKLVCPRIFFREYRSKIVNTLGNRISGREFLRTWGNSVTDRSSQSELWSTDRWRGTRPTSSLLCSVDSCLGIAKLAWLSQLSSANTSLRVPMSANFYISQYGEQEVNLNELKLSLEYNILGTFVFSNRNLRFSNKPTF